jgi:phosphatidylinositol phospholipase C, delta
MGSVRAVLPVVTHGGTLCTVETYEETAVAIGEFAFVASRLPLVISLEMHCSRKQQLAVAKMSVEHFGERLLPVRCPSATA